MDVAAFGASVRIDLPDSLRQTRQRRQDGHALARGVLSAFEQVSRRIGRRETGLRIVTGIYPTASPRCGSGREPCQTPPDRPQRAFGSWLKTTAQTTRSRYPL